MGQLDLPVRRCFSRQALQYPCEHLATTASTNGWVQSVQETFCLSVLRSNMVLAIAALESCAGLVASEGVEWESWNTLWELISPLQSFTCFPLLPLSLKSSSNEIWRFLSFLLLSLVVEWAVVEESNGLLSNILLWSLLLFSFPLLPWLPWLLLLLLATLGTLLALMFLVVLKLLSSAGSMGLLTGVRLWRGVVNSMGGDVLNL